MTPVLIDLRLRTMPWNNEFHDMEMEHGAVAQASRGTDADGWAISRAWAPFWGAVRDIRWWNFYQGCAWRVSYCWWKKSCTSWYGKYPIIYRSFYITSQVVHFFQQYHCITQKSVLYRFVVEEFDMILSSWAHVKCQPHRPVKFAPGSIQVAADLSGGTFSGGDVFTMNTARNGWFQTFEHFCRCETAEKKIDLPFPELTFRNNNWSNSRYT